MLSASVAFITVHEPISPPPKSRRGPVVLFIVLVVILAATVVLGKINTNEYALTPGDATPVAPLVKIKGVASDDASRQDHVDRRLSHVARRLAVAEHALRRVTCSSSVATSWSIPACRPRELGAQGYLEMSDAKQAAEVAAFRRSRMEGTEHRRRARS